MDQRHIQIERPQNQIRQPKNPKSIDCPSTKIASTRVVFEVEATQVLEAPQVFDVLQVTDLKREEKKNSVPSSEVTLRTGRSQKHRSQGNEQFERGTFEQFSKSADEKQPRRQEQSGRNGRNRN